MVKSAYWPLFCEENVWHLAENIASDVEEAWVVFISTPARRVAVWSQTAANPSAQPIIWDYHVILFERLEAGWRVTDPDSSLDTPVDACRYLAASFRDLADEFGELRPMFRIVPALEYRARLCSDRSHMRDAAGGWLAPPPPGPAIGQDTAGGASNLMRFVDMDQPFIGQVCDLDGLQSRLGSG
jgi:hypothetical protein